MAVHVYKGTPMELGREMFLQVCRHSMQDAQKVMNEAEMGNLYAGFIAASVAEMVGASGLKYTREYLVASVAALDGLNAEDVEIERAAEKILRDVMAKAAKGD